MQNRVKEYRKKAGYSQTAFANMVGISRPYLSEIETGKQKEIGSTVMFRIATALKKDIGDIFFTEIVVFTQLKGE